MHCNFVIVAAMLVIVAILCYTVSTLTYYAKRIEKKYIDFAQSLYKCCTIYIDEAISSENVLLKSKAKLCTVIMWLLMLPILWIPGYIASTLYCCFEMKIYNVD